MADGLTYTREVIPTDRAPVTADVARCACGERAFVVFQVLGDTHVHLWCPTCGVAYCPAGGACRAGG